jgi:ankyrin repeat protein
VSTEVVNGYGRTALLEAALENKLECVRACLEAGANVDFTTKMQGNTAAHLAAQSGHVEVLNLLRDAGARMDIERFGDLKTALQLHREAIARTMKTMLDR